MPPPEGVVGASLDDHIRSTGARIVGKNSEDHVRQQVLPGVYVYGIARFQVEVGHNRRESGRGLIGRDSAVTIVTRRRAKISADWLASLMQYWAARPPGAAVNARRIAAMLADHGPCRTPFIRPARILLLFQTAVPSRGRRPAHPPNSCSLPFARLRCPAASARAVTMAGGRWRPVANGSG